MKQLVYEHEFINDLISDDYASFTREGAKELYEHLTDWEEDTGEVYDFDRVAIRCEWSEYDSLENNFINSIRKTHDMENIDDMEE